MAEQYEDALTQLKRILEKAPDNVEALNDQGIALCNLERWKQTVDTYLRALDVDPDSPMLWENLAEVLRRGTFSEDQLNKVYQRLTVDQTNQSQRLILRQIGHQLPEVATYRSAYAQCNITPQDTCVTQGWLGNQQADRSISPLLLQAFLVEDENHNKLLFIAADLFGIGETLLESVRESARTWGIPPEAVVINASHTHYAPGTVERVVPGIGPYYSQYAQHIANAVNQLLAHLHGTLQPCFIYAGKTDVQIGINRRLERTHGVALAPNPKGYYHTDTPFLVVDLLEDKNRVVIVNHGCHPTGSGQPTFVSSGYPGYLRQKLIADGVADGVMFLQGAAGSSKLALNGKSKPARFTKSPEEAKQCAEKIANEVSATMGEELDVVRGPIFARLEQSNLSIEKGPEKEELEAMPVSENGVERILEENWAHHFLNGAQTPGNTIDFQVQLVGLGGEVGFITFPGEPVAELARSILNNVDVARNAFFLGYTNGLKAYLPTRQIVEEGGYEGDTAKMVYLLPSTFRAEVEEELTEGVRRLVKHWKDSSRPNGYGRYHLASKQGDAFFCLSTGRCGTKTLAHLLSTATNARVYHHPRPYLVEETLEAYQGGIDQKETFWRARGGVVRDAWKDGLVFGETDHNMTAFAPAIHDELDRAKFIVLVRNPWDFVRSGMRRQYYKNHPWDEGRLCPSKGHPDHEVWGTMTPFQKVCWLWNETYQRIADFIEELPSESYRIVQFEELIDTRQVTADLFDFLGLEGFEDQKVKDILGKKLNRQQRGDFERPSQWGTEKHEVLWSMCQNTIETLDLKAYQAMHDAYMNGSTDDAHPSSDLNKTNPPGLCTDAPEENRISATTIWDYKKFKYQAYPERISPSVIVSANSKRPLIDRSTPIASMGSCFARNVARYLLQRGFNYLVTEQPFQQASAHWDQVFNTACMRQIFEYSLTDQWNPVVRWWPKGENVQDPYRRDILYPKASRAEHFERHRKASRQAIEKSDIIILTLGLIETWRDQRDQATYYRVPSPSIYDPEVHEFYVQTVQDCTEDLDTIHGLLARANPEAQLVVTVSPVPLFATFRMDVDVVSANRLSKSTLRVAAEYFAQKYENVHYFPAYEIVTQGMDDPYKEDNRHVTTETISTVMKAFESLYVR